MLHDGGNNCTRDDPFSVCLLTYRKNSVQANNSRNSFSWASTFYYDVCVPGTRIYVYSLDNMGWVKQTIIAIEITMKECFDSVKKVGWLSKSYSYRKFNLQRRNFFFLLFTLHSLNKDKTYIKNNNRIYCKFEVPYVFYSSSPFFIIKQIQPNRAIFS